MKNLIKPILFIVLIAFYSCSGDDDPAPAAQTPEPEVTIDPEVTPEPEPDPITQADYNGVFKMEDFDVTIHIALLDTSFILPVATFPAVAFKIQDGLAVHELDADLKEFVKAVSNSLLGLFEYAIDSVKIDNEVLLEISDEGFKIDGFNFLINSTDDYSDPVNGSFIAEGRLEGTEIIMDFRLYITEYASNGPLRFEGTAIGNKE